MRAEERLMHVFQLVLLVRESVYIMRHMVHTLVWLEVDIEALDYPWHLITRVVLSAEKTHKMV